MSDIAPYLPALPSFFMNFEEKRLSISEGVFLFDPISQLHVQKSIDLKIHLGQLNFLKLFLLKDQKYLCQDDRCKE